MDEANSIPVGTLKLGSVKNAMRSVLSRVVRTNKWKFQNMTLLRGAYVIRMKYHVIIHCIFVAPKKFLLFPKYDLADHLKKEKRAGLNCWWNRWFQTFWASVYRHCRKPHAHTHGRGGVWSSTSDVECRRRLLYSASLYAPTHHRSDRVMVEQLQHSAGLQRCFKHPCTPASCCSCHTWPQFSSCSGTWKFLIFPRNFKNSRSTNWNSEGDNLNAEDFDGL